MFSTQSQQADELRKQGKYIEAIPLYRELIKTSTSSYPTRWLVNCLRKSGDTDAAFQVGQEALKKFPNDQYLRSEMAWVIYDRDIKPGREANDFGRVVNASRRALQMDPQNKLLTSTTCQAVIKTGKKTNNPDWKTIAEFADKIDPASLSTEKRKNNDGKQYLSEREDWYVNAAHAHLKCGDFDRAEEIAKEGLLLFKDEIFLIRTIAHAQFQSGDVQNALETMRPLLNHPRTGWYIRSELAEMEIKQGNLAEAYRLLCQALLTKQDDKFKVNDLETFASLANRMEKLTEANTALAFAIAIRTGAGWSLPESLKAAQRECKLAFQNAGIGQPEPAEDLKVLAKKCYSIWNEGALEGVERQRGKVTQVRPDRKYAFIQPLDGREGVIVFMRDLPRDCAVDGIVVEYSLEKSFDIKKNRDSFKAVQVQKVK